MKKIWIMAIAAVSLMACSKNESTSTQSAEVEKVGVTVLHPTKIDREITLSGNLQGYEVLEVAPSVTGIVEHIYVEEGALVKKGQDLVRMDQTQYLAAQLNYNNAKVDMERMEGLIATGSCSKQAYDQQKLALNQYKVNMDFLSQNTFYKAPFAGVVTAKNLVDGSMYAGSPILELQEIDKMKVWIAIPETYVASIHPGLKVTLKVDAYGDEAFPAVIEIINPKIDASTHTFQVKVVAQNPKMKLRPGMYVNTTIPTGEDEAILAPYSTVLKLIGANNRYVFLNENGVAKRVDVEMGQRTGEMVEIIAPEIKDGVELVTEGEGRLVDGSKLDIVEKL